MVGASQGGGCSPLQLLGETNHWLCWAVGEETVSSTLISCRSEAALGRRVSSSTRSSLWVAADQGGGSIRTIQFMFKQEGSRAVLRVTQTVYMMGWTPAWRTPSPCPPPGWANDQPLPPSPIVSSTSIIINIHYQCYHSHPVPAFPAFPFASSSSISRVAIHMHSRVIFGLSVNIFGYIFNT